MLEGAAADRRIPEVDDQEEPGGGPDLVRLGGRARRRVEAGPGSALELGEVGAQALPRVRMGRVDRPDLHEGSRQEPLDVAHRADEPLALAVDQRLEERPGELVAPPVDDLALGEPGRREPRRPRSAVAHARHDFDQPGRLERAEQPAGVPGVETEPRTQSAHLAALLPDLPEHPRLPERPAAGEVAVVERPDPLGHGTVEAADLRDHRLVHSLILVRDLQQVSAIR